MGTSPVSLYSKKEQKNMVEYKKPEWIVAIWETADGAENETKDHKTVMVNADTAEQAMRCIKKYPRDLMHAYPKMKYIKAFS